MDTDRSLEQELKQLILEVCDLQEADPDALGPTDPLIGPDSPWDLDSLDAVEIIMAVQEKYHWEGEFKKLQSVYERVLL